MEQTFCTPKLYFKPTKIGGLELNMNEENVKQEQGLETPPPQNYYPTQNNVPPAGYSTAQWGYPPYTPTSFK